MSDRGGHNGAASADVRVAAGAVLDLWDRLIGLAADVGPDALSLPTPCPNTDVEALIAHVAGVHGAASGQRSDLNALVHGLRTARAAQAAEIAAWSAGDPSRITVRPTMQRRLLGARCLDLWVHAHDLATAIGAPVALDENSPAVANACAYVWDYVPQLLARRAGIGEDSAVRVALRGGDEHDAVAVGGGRGRWTVDHDGAEHAVSAELGAFLLLLSGRGQPEHWQAQGALAWSGALGEAFVRQARLLE